MKGVPYSPRMSQGRGFPAAVQMRGGGSSGASLKPFLCSVLDKEGEILLSAIKTRKVEGMEPGSGAFERDLCEAWVYEPFSWVGWSV